MMILKSVIMILIKTAIAMIKKTIDNDDDIIINELTYTKEDLKITSVIIVVVRGLC